MKLKSKLAKDYRLNSPSSSSGSSDETDELPSVADDRPLGAKR